MSAPSELPVVYLGVSWADPAPNFRARRQDEPAATHVPALGHEFRHGTLDRRACLGHVARSPEGATRIDCHRPPVDGRTCRRCGGAEAAFAAGLHRAHLLERHQVDTRVRPTLEQPNVLYLAGFRDGSIKVGTSVDRRRAIRLAEQGAWMAVVVARTADGYVVRELEDAVTEELGIPQTVAGSRKIDGLVHPLPDAELRGRLTREVHRVLALIDTLRWSGAEPAQDWWSSPCASGSIWNELHPYPLALDSGNHRVTVLGLCGRFAAVRTPQLQETFAVDLGRLFGQWVQPGEVDSDELAVQATLF